MMKNRGFKKASDIPALSLVAAGQDASVKNDLLLAGLVACCERIQKEGYDFTNDDPLAVEFWKEHKLARRAGFELFRQTVEILLSDNIVPEKAQESRQSLSRN